METQAQFELRKSKALAKLRIEAGKDKYVYKRHSPKIHELIRRWEAWTYADEIEYQKRQKR